MLYNDEKSYQKTTTLSTLHLKGPFSSPEEMETFLSRFEAARLLLAPGVNKRNATTVLLDLQCVGECPSIKEQNIQVWEGNDVGLCRLV